MERSPSREEYEIVGLPEGFLGFSVAGGKRGKKYKDSSCNVCNINLTTDKNYKIIIISEIDTDALWHCKV